MKTLTTAIAANFTIWGYEKMNNTEYAARIQAAKSEKEIKAIKEQNANDLRKEYLRGQPRKSVVNVCRATKNWNGCDYCDYYGGTGLECWKQNGPHNCKYCEQVKRG